MSALIIVPHLFNTGMIINDVTSAYIMDDFSLYCLSVLVIAVNVSCIFLARLFWRENAIEIMWICLLSTFLIISVVLIADFTWISIRAMTIKIPGYFIAIAKGYFYEKSVFYILMIAFMGGLILSKKTLFKNHQNEKSAPIIFFFIKTLCLGTVILNIEPLVVEIIFKTSSVWSNFRWQCFFNSVFFLVVFTSISLIHYVQKRQTTHHDQIKNAINRLGWLCIGLFITKFMLLVFVPNYFHQSTWENFAVACGNMLLRNFLEFVPLIIAVQMLIFYLNFYKKKQFSIEESTNKTSGDFGSAQWATKKYLHETLNAFDKQVGPIVGKLDDALLHLPLLNKLTISPQGGGKSAASSIPVLLTENRPVFVLDFKGELWATTARHRAEVFGRKVITIDPFNIIQEEAFSQGKPEHLFQKYQLNPFEWLPEEREERDRMLNAFSNSLVSEEQGTTDHFTDNAKILLRGYIDYIMTLDKSQRNLESLYGLLSENAEDAIETYEAMSQAGGRAADAAHQIIRVGSDERGSILSTTYRQIDWIGDSNIKSTFSTSNFNLYDFLKGDMDVYVILPSDQIKTHGRVVRMLLSLLMGLISQAKPNELPNKKMLFLLDELGQLGKCPDVEQCIEILRARGVVVWTVFQTLNQIKLFAKPDLFLSVPIKQIFTNDDTETMKWIQALGGKKTIVTKTLSANKGSSRKNTQLLSGNLSAGEGESLRETGADLIQFNEIRELAKDEQYVFYHGGKPIKCKKVFYFEHAFFAGKYDNNPLEHARQ
jgi:type IV secretion system protein VirD4